METLLIDYKKNPELIKKASDILANGGIGIFPTDTVYGIGCDCLNEKSIHNLYQFKQRNIKKPISILVSNIDMIYSFVKNINDIEKKIMEKFWPGALTIVFNKSQVIPDLLTSGYDTVGIRMPNSNITLDLINKLGKPIATSSANISDNAPDSNLEDISNDFLGKVDFIINNGNNDINTPSTVIRVIDNKVIILRQGLISLDKINSILGGEKDVK